LQIYRFNKIYSEIQDVELSDPLETLGSKGYHLHRMAQLGFNVPSGFVISSDISKGYLFESSVEAAQEKILEAIKWLEFYEGKKFGAGLKVSVRSGSKFSMPGMMDTFLDVKTPDELMKRIEDVVASWYSDRAVTYRKMDNIPDSVGTAVTVQTMVYGDADDNSGTGVCFTRFPSDGFNQLYGEFLPMARGEAIVSGSITPLDISRFGTHFHTNLCVELEKTREHLERVFKDMQEFEFTIEKGELWILQTRPGKRSPQAAAKIAVELVRGKILTKKEAIENVKKYIDIDKRQPRLVISNDNFDFSTRVIAEGIAASPGIAIGCLVFNTWDAEITHIPPILVTRETTTKDVAGMAVSRGVLTKIGGSTSHAATIARGMNIPCVVGCSALEIDEKKRMLTINGQKYSELSLISIDGNTGKVYAGRVDCKVASEDRCFDILKQWSDIE